MVTSTTDIQTGMTVYSSDGEEIGTVKEVYPNTGPTAGRTDDAGDVVVEEVVVAEVVPVDPLGAETVYEAVVLEPTDTPSGTQSGGPSETGYIKVEHGGILGIGAKDLYIPLSAVTNVEPGDSITVSCRKDECTKQYEAKPDFLEKGDNTDKRS